MQDRADRRKVAKVTVLQEIKSGELRAIDTDRSWRFADADLKYFLKVRATSPPKQDDASANLVEPRS